MDHLVSQNRGNVVGRRYSLDEDFYSSAISPMPGIQSYSPDSNLKQGYRIQPKDTNDHTNNISNPKD